MFVGYFVEPVLNLADLRMAILNAGEKKKLIEEVKKEFAVDLSGSEKCRDFSTIQFDKIEHSFEKTDINIKTDVHIEIPGFYGITAPSGLGKSTVLKIISGLLYSETANILIGNKKVSCFSPDSLNGKVFYLSDKSVIFKGTVKENVEFSENSKITNEVFEFIFDASDDVSLDTKLETGGKNISLGQKQRVVLLRLFALKNKPKIIILDEALSGVDEQRERAIIEKLKQEFSDSIVLYITHRKKSFELCDKVFEFQAG